MGEGEAMEAMGEATEVVTAWSRPIVARSRRNRCRGLRRSCTLSQGPVRTRFMRLYVSIHEYWQRWGSATAHGLES